MTYLTLRASKKFSMRLHYPLWVFEIEIGTQDSILHMTGTEKQLTERKTIELGLICADSCQGIVRIAITLLHYHYTQLY